MFTKPLIQQSIATVDTSKDMDTLTRVLVAAAVNSRFCADLLKDPQHALQTGFGGEGFPLSQAALSRLVSIQASTLPEFITKLNEALAGI